MVIVAAAVLALFPSSTQALVPYDDFGLPRIDATKWDRAEFVREIRGSALVSEVRSLGPFVTDFLPLASPSGVTAIQADVRVELIDTPSAGHAQARLFQKIYNDGTSATLGVGDIGAQVTIIQAFGFAPSARVALFRCADTPCTAAAAQTLISRAFPSVTPSLNQVSTFSIQWDGSVVTFRFNNQQLVVSATEVPAVARPQPDIPLVSVGTSAAGRDAHVRAAFDNVVVNGLPFDNFAANELDASKWAELERVRESRSGTLRLRARTARGVNSVFLGFPLPQDMKAIAATVAVSEIGIGASDNQVARLIGTFYKSTGQSGGTGFDGDISGAVRITGNQAFGLQASFTMFRCLGPTCSFAPHIFTEFLGPVELGRPVRLFLQWDGLRFTYGVDGDTRTKDPSAFAPVLSTDPTLNTKGLDVQAFGFGSITATFDDVLASSIPAPTALRAQVGERKIYLNWNPSPIPVDGYNIHVEKLDSVTGMPVLSGTASPTGVLIQNPRFRVFAFFPGGRLPSDLLDNDFVYRIAVSAVDNGIEGPRSSPVFARPGPQVVPRRIRPIVFLHGFLGSSRRTTFDDTIDYITTTLKWVDGGHLRDDDLPPLLNPLINPLGDFFTVDFTNNTGGLDQQGQELARILSGLKVARVRFPITLVAHSNGGLAARAFLLNNPALTNDVAEFITYGTPHAGADIDTWATIVRSLVALGTVATGGAFLALVGAPSLSALQLALNTDGAQDAAFQCDIFGNRVLSPFLQRIRTPLPAHITHVSIVSHDHNLTFLGPFAPLGNRRLLGLRDCHSEHWDGLVPISSANLFEAQVASQPVRSFTTPQFHIGQGNDFTSIQSALDPLSNNPTLVANVASPVDVEVTAPDGRSISRNFTAIPGASYMEFEDETGHTTATIMVPFALTGDYAIKVSPKPGALPTDTYSLEVTVGDKTKTLARDVLVQSIPTVPYVTQAIVPFAALEVDRANARVRRTATRIELRGEFALGLESDGLALPDEAVAINLGDFRAVIPSGSFVRYSDDDGRDSGREFQFFGNGGAIERVTIKKDKRGNEWEFRIRARGEEIAALDLGQPIPFALRIGDDRGEAEVRFDTKRRAADRD